MTKKEISTHEFFDNYKEFVSTLTSDCSMNHEDYITRLNELKSLGCDISKLDTAATGMAAESGEFIEIVKKIKFQSKPWNEENIFHLKREMGDIIFYWIIACVSLDIDPIEVVTMNVDKLKSRYENGTFDVFKSENRKDGDVWMKNHLKKMDKQINQYAKFIVGGTVLIYNYLKKKYDEAVLRKIKNDE